MKNAYCGCCNVEVEDWNKHEATPLHQRNVAEKLRRMEVDENDPRMRMLYSNMAMEEWVEVEPKDYKIEIACNSEDCASEEEGVPITRCMEHDIGLSSYVCPDCGNSVVIKSIKVERRFPKAI